MQMIERPWGITVYSTASVKAAPDLVRLRFQVARMQQTPAEAFAAATEAVGAVRRAIRAHNVPDADVQRSRPSLKSQWNFGMSASSWLQCQASFSVESRDLDDVQQLLVDVVGRARTNVDRGCGLRRHVTSPACEPRRDVQWSRRRAEGGADASGGGIGCAVQSRISREDRRAVRSQYRH